MTTLLHEATIAKKFDTRMVDRNIDRGLVTAQEHEQLLKTLPDDEANADWISIEQLHADNVDPDRRPSTH